MEILGYLGALIVGLTLGLLGAGGSILTVPVFDSDDEALTYSFERLILNPENNTLGTPNCKKSSERNSVC